MKYFVDGNYLMHRSMHKGINLKNSKGEITGGAYIFLRVLFSINEPLSNVVVVFDGGHSPRRKQLLETYKQKDVTSEDDSYIKEFYNNVRIAKEILPTLGVSVVQEPETEADDVIYVLATQVDNSAVYTDDEDYLQLLQYGVSVIRPMKGEAYYSDDEFEEKFGFSSKYLPLKKALMGDPSDNIPGVPGVGNSRATKVAITMHQLDLEPTVEDLKFAIPRANIPESTKKAISENFDIVERNLQLIDFRYVDIQPPTIPPASPNIMEAVKLMNRYEFKSLIPKVFDLVGG